MSSTEGARNASQHGIDPAGPPAQPYPSPDIKVDGSDDFKQVQSSQSSPSEDETAENVKRPWWYSIKEPGSATQIILAAILAIGIGMAVVSTTDEVPQAAIDIIGIPGSLWLRALKCVGMEH
jgi:hypothetical protein